MNAPFLEFKKRSIPDVADLIPMLSPKVAAPVTAPAIPGVLPKACPNHFSSTALVAANKPAFMMNVF